MSSRSASPAVTPKTQPARRGRSTSVPVKVIAGCSAIDARTHGGGRLEDGEAVATRGVGDVLALADRAGGAEHGDHVGEHVVGDGEQQQVAGPGDVGGLREGYAGQQRRDAPAGGVGLAGHGDDLVARAAEGGGQGRADATGADGADPQARAGLGHLVRTSRFSPSAPDGAGRVPLDVLVTARGYARRNGACEQSVNVTYPTREPSAGAARVGQARRCSLAWSGSSTAKGRGARGSHAWVTWSTTCTPVGRHDLGDALGDLAVVEGVEDRPLAALAPVADARRERRRVGPVRELVAVEVLELDDQALRQREHPERLGRRTDLPLRGLGVDEVRAHREAPLLDVAQAEVEVRRGVVLDVEPVARDADHRVGHPDLPRQVGQRDLALGGEDHVAVPLPRVAGPDVAEAPVVEVGQRVHRPLVDGQVLGAGAGDGERVLRERELVRQAGVRRRGARRLAGAVVGAVVDDEHVVAGPQQRRQHEAHRRRLVLDPQHGGRAAAQAALAVPGPDDVEVGVPLEVGQAVARADRDAHPCGPLPTQRLAYAAAYGRRDLGAHVVRDPVGQAAGRGRRRRRRPPGRRRSGPRRPTTC